MSSYRFLVPFTVLGFALACTGGTEEAPPPEEPTCDLSMLTLNGRTFVRQVPDDSEDGYDEDILARLTFFEDEGVQKVKYTVRSHFSVYDYTCADDGGRLTCLQDVVDYMEWCRALYAQTGECTPEAVLAVLGRPTAPVPEDVKTAVEKALLGIKKIKQPSEDWDFFLKGYNNPNVQLRGKLSIGIKNKGDECRLTVSDTYQTVYQKQLAEFENLVGSAYFTQWKGDELLFEHCPPEGAGRLVMAARPDDWPKETNDIQKFPKGFPVLLRYGGEKETKANSSCTYSMDTYSHYTLVGRGVPVTVASTGKLDWSYTSTFNEIGPTTGTLVRYKTCGGGMPSKIDVVCAPAKVPDPALAEDGGATP